MSKLQLELMQKESTKESEVKKHDIRHVMVQTESDDQSEQVANQMLLWVQYCASLCSYLVVAVHKYV